jgi:hypothetical protein
MRAAGWSVPLVDHRPLGGTCALRGCDPKRVLMSGGEAIDAETRMRGHGVTGEARIDWRDLMMFKRSFTDAVPRNLEKYFAENGIDAFHGFVACYHRTANSGCYLTAVRQPSRSVFTDLPFAFDDRRIGKRSALDACCVFRHWAGVMPIYLLNARWNAASD